MTTIKWEYKSLRFDYIGRGITQEINLLDIDGVRIKGWGTKNRVPSLPVLLADLGREGWEMVAHVVNQDNKNNGVTFHYMQFKRIYEVEFDVILKDICINKSSENALKMLELKTVISAATGLALKECEELTENLPLTIREGLSKDAAETLRNKLEDVGGKVEVKQV